ncbi:hypothetical protein [Limnoglobus roseus]|uniref:Uncharacterized protein n=1 Tax=Limnoglobus roseus TaxID=2598579 RepID=A0A5C1AE34_9BACT|nr:hypothetical protein [Limnoglobus roseus]QEL15384.1 hypothetical protein PX52LOC_02299 [Limnoglobus roseus]
MPYTRCPKCRHEQYATHAILGLQIECKKCGRAYLAKDEAENESEPLVSTESPFGERPVLNILKSVGFLFLLIAVVGLVFWGIVSLIRPTPKGIEKKNTDPQAVENRNVAREPAELPARRGGRMPRLNG